MVKDNAKEREVLYLYTIKNKKPKDIVSRLQISKQSVNYYINKIKKRQGKKVKIVGGGALPKSKKNLWRVEALFFKVNPYYTTDKYKKITTTRGNYGIPEGKYTLMLYRDHIRIQSKEGVYFDGATKEEAIIKAEQDFNGFLDKIKYKYGFYPIKDGRVSIKLCSMELAKEDCTIAKQHENVTDKTYYLVKDDRGKVCFKFDRSKGVAEREYIGSEVKENSENGESFFRDIFMEYDKNPVPYSTTTQRQDWIVDVLHEYAVNMKTHVGVMKKMDVTMSTMGKTMLTMDKTMQDIRDSLKK